MGGLIILVVMFGALWVLFILPQQRRMKAHQAIVAQVEVGDDVMTSAGIYGRVTDIRNDILHLEIAPGVVVRVARGAVADRTPADPTEGPAAPEAAEAAEPADDVRPASSGAVVQPRRGVLRRREPASEGSPPSQSEN
jgi:preprotein translocase subunit YajC